MYTVSKVHLTLKIVFANADSNSNSKYRVYSKLIFFSWQMSKFTHKYMNTFHTHTQTHAHNEGVRSSSAKAIVLAAASFCLCSSFVSFFLHALSMHRRLVCVYVARRSPIDTGSFKQNKTIRSLSRLRIRCFASLCCALLSIDLTFMRWIFRTRVVFISYAVCACIEAAFVCRSTQG